MKTNKEILLFKSWLKYYGYKQNPVSAIFALFDSGFLKINPETIKTDGLRFSKIVHRLKTAGIFENVLSYKL